MAADGFDRFFGDDDSDIQRRISRLAEKHGVTAQRDQRCQTRGDQQQGERLGREFGGRRKAWQRRGIARLGFNWGQCNRLVLKNRSRCGWLNASG